MEMKPGLMRFLHARNKTCRRKDPESLAELHTIHINTDKWPSSPWVLVAQWIELSLGGHEFDSCRLRTRILSLSHSCIILINSPFTFQSYWTSGKETVSSSQKPLLDPHILHLFGQGKFVFFYQGKVKEFWQVMSLATIFILFQASSFQWLKLENLLRWSLFTFIFIQ